MDPSLEAADGAAKKQTTAEAGESGKTNQKEDSQVIDLPTPYAGNMNSPLETVTYISNMIEKNPSQSGKSYVREYKEKIMSEGRIPIRKSQPNALVKQNSEPGKVAPLNWNMRGAKETGWESIFAQFQAKQAGGCRGQWLIHVMLYWRPQQKARKR